MGLGFNFWSLSVKRISTKFHAVFVEKFCIEKDGIMAGRIIEGKSWEALKSQSHTEMNTLIVWSMWAI